MKKLILLLSIVPALALAQGVKQSGWTTTTDPSSAMSSLFQRGAIIPSPSSIYGALGGTINWNTNSGAGGDVYQGRFRLSAPAGGGFLFQDSTHLVNWGILSNGFLSLNNAGFVGVDNSVKIGAPFPAPPMVYNFWWDAGLTNTAAGISNFVNSAVWTNLQAAGYNTLAIDDGWMNSTRTGGRLTVNTNYFPGGLTNISAFLHSRGIKLWSYLSYSGWNTAATTCGGLAGTPDIYMQQDILDLAAWGVDGVKVDDCGVDWNDPYGLIKLAQVASSAIVNLPFVSGYGGTNATPFALLASMRRDLPSDPLLARGPGWLALRNLNVWENPTPDSSDSVPTALSEFKIAYYDNAPLMRPGHYVELIGLHAASPAFPSYAYSTNTQKAYVAGSVMMSSAMIIGGINATNQTYWTNREVNVIGQNPLVLPPVLVSSNANREIYVKPLSTVTGASNAVMFWNINSSSSMTLYATNCGLASDELFSVRDLWAGADLGYFTNSFAPTIAATNTGLYLVSRAQEPQKTGRESFILPANAITWDSAFNSGSTLGIVSGYSPAPYFFTEGHKCVGTTDGVFVFTVPNRATNVWLSATFQTSTNSHYWTNLFEPFYYTYGAGRTYNSGGIANSTQIIGADNTATNWTTPVIVFPNSNVLKQVKVTWQASTNVATRYLISPITIIWQ